MKKIFAAFFMTASVVGCFCQNLPDLKAYHSDIGFNTNFVLNGIFQSGGNGNPFDLMLKKQKTENTAWRFGTSLFVNTSNDLSFYQQNYAQYDNYNFSISLGKEFQKQINKHWIFYYGADLSPFIAFTQREYYAQDFTTPNLEYYLLNRDRTNTYGLKVIPFLGIRFNINERLYVATQTNLFLTVNKKSVTVKSIDNITSSPGNYNYFSNEKSFYGGTVNIAPASGIFFFYRF